jgi:hypothetical protein
MRKLRTYIVVFASYTSYTCRSCRCLYSARLACVSMRQHTSAHAQHSLSIRSARICKICRHLYSARLACVSMRHHTSACASIRQHTSERFQQQLPASVACRSTAAPVRLQCPVPLAVGSSNGSGCACSRRKNVRRCTDAPKRDSA